MAKSIWEFDLDGNKHKVELSHGNVTGRIDILADGKKIDIPKSEQPKFLESVSKHNFNISEHSCKILIELNGSRYVYKLLVDGQPIIKSADQDRREQEQSNELRSMVVAPLLVVLGGVAFWYNWNLAHGEGLFSRSLALLSPLPIIFALHLLLFPNDVSKFSSNAVIRIVVAILLAVLLGWVNYYALSNGLY